MIFFDSLEPLKFSQRKIQGNESALVFIIRILLENMGIIEPWCWDSEVTYKHREPAGWKMRDVSLDAVPNSIVELKEDQGLILGAVE